MREIKFRAFEDGMMIMENMVVNKIRDDQPRSWVLGQFFSMIRGDAIVMQYTGLRDKNGKEIYEGDNIKFTYWWFDGNEAESTLEGTVVYTPETMSYSIEGIKNAEWLRHIGGEENNEPDTSPFALFQFEEADFLVTGNIYENGKA